MKQAPLRRAPVISARDYLTDSWRLMGRIGVIEVPGTHCSVDCFFPPVSLIGT